MADGKTISTASTDGDTAASNGSTAVIANARIEHASVEHASIDRDRHSLPYRIGRGLLRFLGRLLRWILTLLFILLLLGLLAGVGLYLALNSSLPKGIASSVATDLLGLDVGLGDLKIGLDGKVRGQDLTVRLPSRAGTGQGEKILEAPDFEAELGSLPALAFSALTGGTPLPEFVRVSNPTVYATQAADGTWNVAEAAELIAGSLGGGGGDPDAPASAIKLPDLPGLEIEDARVVVRNNAGETETAEGIDVTGRELSPLIYEAGVDAPGLASVKADLVPSNGRTQTAGIRLDGDGVRRLLRPVLGEGALPEDLGLDATWDGQFTGDGGVAGTLTFDDPTGAAGVGLRGPLQISLTPDGTLAAQPGGLSLTGLDLPGGDVEVLAGGVNAGPEAVSVDELLIKLLGGKIKVEELAYSVPDQTATLRARFQNIGNFASPGEPLPAAERAGPVADELPPELKGEGGEEAAGQRDLPAPATLPGDPAEERPQGPADFNGTVVADLWYGPFGEPRGRLTLETDGSVLDYEIDKFSAAVEIEGEGYDEAGVDPSRFLTLDLAFSVPERIIVRGGAGETTPLAPIKGLVRVRLADENPYVELTQLEAVDAAGSLAAQGRFYLAQEDRPARYGLWVEGTGWPVTPPRMEGPLPLDLGVVVAGEIGEGGYIGPGAVNIANVYGRYGDIDITGDGWYLFEVPEGGGRDVDGDGRVDDPLSLTLAVRREGKPPLTQAALAEAQAEAGDAGEDRFENFDAQDDIADDLPPGDALPGGLLAEADLDAIAGGEAQPPVIAGEIEGYLSIWGDVTPTDLDVIGQLDTRGFALGLYDLGDVSTGLTANVTGERLTLATRDAAVLGADLFSLVADVPYDEEQPGTVELDVAGLSLARVCEAAGIEVGGEAVRGTLDADLTAWLRGFDLDAITLDGVASVRELDAFTGRVADRLTIFPTLNEQELSAYVELRRAPLGADDPALAPDAQFVDGRLVPAADAPDLSRTLRLTAIADLKDLSRFVVRDLRADQYPFVLGPQVLGGEVTGAARVTLDSDELVLRLPPEGEPATPPGGVDDLPLTIEGRVAANLIVSTGPTPFDLRPLVELDLAARADQTVVVLETLSGTLTNVGWVEAGGALELADLPGRSNLWLESVVDLGRLAERLDLPEGGAGTVKVVVGVSPQDGEATNGEVLAQVGFKGTRARWRSVEIDGGSVKLWLSRPGRPDGSPSRGQYDFTLATADGTIRAAGGTTEFFAKVRDVGARVDGGEGSDLRLTSGATVSNVQLAQLGPVIGEEEVEGDLFVGVNAYGSLAPPPPQPSLRPGGRPEAIEVRPPVALNGEGSIQVVNGRIRQFDLFAAILERVNVLPVSARDRVDAEFALEQGGLRITGGEAFIGGVEIRGNLNVDNIFAGGESPIGGRVLVLFKPLDAFNLPGLDLLQELLDAAQQNVTGFRLTRTLGQPLPVPLPLSSFRETFGALLGVNTGADEDEDAR